MELNTICQKKKKIVSANFSDVVKKDEVKTVETPESVHNDMLKKYFEA